MRVHSFNSIAAVRTKLQVDVSFLRYDSLWERASFRRRSTSELVGTPTRPHRLWRFCRQCMSTRTETVRTVLSNALAHPVMLDMVVLPYFTVTPVTCIDTRTRRARLFPYLSRALAMPANDGCAVELALQPTAHAQLTLGATPQATTPLRS